MLQSALLGDDETEYLWLDLDGDPEIDLRVTYADGGSETYEDLDLTGVDEAYRVLDDNTIELDETASEVTARIYNDLGEDYTLTYIEASPADGDDWYTVSSGDVEDGDYVSEDFDLDADGSEWDFYFEVYDAYDDEYEDYYLYGVDFDDAYDDNPYLYIEWYDSGEDDLDYTLD